MDMNPMQECLGNNSSNSENPKELQKPLKELYNE